MLRVIIEILPNGQRELRRSRFHGDRQHKQFGRCFGLPDRRLGISKSFDGHPVSFDELQSA
jgi:hypothetical protein